MSIQNKVIELKRVNSEIKNLSMRLKKMRHNARELEKYICRLVIANIPVPTGTVFNVLTGCPLNLLFL